MESKNELKQTDSKNLTSHYFDDIVRDKDIYSGDILLRDSIKYLISEKGGITDIINHNSARIRIDSYNSLPVQKNIDFS